MSTADTNPSSGGPNKALQATRYRARLSFHVRKKKTLIGVCRSEMRIQARII